MHLTTLTLCVFLSILGDNLLLTVVVPIIPEFLREKASLALTKKISILGDHDRGQVESTNGIKLNLSTTLPYTSIEQSEGTRRLEGDHVDRVKFVTESCFKELFHLQILDEDSKLGLLFSTKAIVQLISNPLVGRLTVRCGYKLLLCIGNALLCLCALAFGFADSYILLLIGRSCHGLASSLVTISGMALIAELYPIDAQRTVCMGRAMGATALGVLIGYPFGGFFYAMLGKLFPFLVIAVVALLNSVLCGYQLQLGHLTTAEETQTLTLSKLSTDAATPIPPHANVSSCWSLLKDRSIMIVFLAIWFSTMGIAVLEPTLPMWLIETIDPPKWELGLVFVPDSIGYFIGTTFFGHVALQFGRWKVSMISMGTIGFACLILPFCRAIWQLTFPHFALGLGLGIVDASLMPLLACLADERHKATTYGSVYAVAQTSVALAYSLGPLVAGQFVRFVGFPDLIRSVGFLNLVYSPFLLLLIETVEEKYRTKEGHRPEDDLLSSSTTCSSIDQSVFSERGGSINKKVRFQFLLNSESLPLKAAVDKRYPVQPPTSGDYERFYNELDSD